MALLEYIVTLKNFEDLESFYDDMETPGGTVYIPNRAVGLANRRPISRNTHYYLTESEAEQLRGDSRVLAVEQLPSARGIFPKPTWTQTANYEKSATIDSNDKNWALYRCTEGAQTEGWATNGNATVLNRTVNATSSGRNVDVIIVDSHLKFDHPEFAVNPDGTGGSRAIQFNWWQYSANIGLATTGSYSYSSVADSHGTHVAGTAAGNTQGWARDANIYNIEFLTAYISGLPGSTDFDLYVFDYIREFHRNKPINPVTGRKNPTVVNNSWGYNYNYGGDYYLTGNTSVNYIASITYRGGTTTLSGSDNNKKTQAQDNGVPVVELLGGACRDKMEAYASGGWASADNIGNQLNGYIEKGFSGVKMRVGIMDQTVAESVKRVKAAREAIGPDIKLMTDAHGTFSVPEAKQFCRGVEDCNLYWFEEPISPDNRHGTAEVRQATSIPIALGESEFTAFDIRDLIEVRAMDVVQPDSAIIGGITESMRVAHLAHTYQLELAPHCWGSAFSFMAGVNVAFAAPAAVVIEFSLGGNPMMYDLVNEKITVENGMISAPTAPGLGLTPNWDFVHEFKQKINH